MKAFISYMLAITLTVPANSLSAAQAGGQTSPPASSSRPAGAAQPADGGWPRAYNTASGGRIVLYEPQVASWPDQKHMVMYTAVAYTASGAKTPTLGTLKIEANTQVAVAERLVSFSEFTITESHFPTLSRDQVRMVIDEITSSVPRNERVIGLDRVLAAVDTSDITPKNVDGVKADPPVIFFSQTPAILVNIDEEPIWSPIKDNDLRFADSLSRVSELRAFTTSERCGSILLSRCNRPSALTAPRERVRAAGANPAPGAIATGPGVAAPDVQRSWLCNASSATFSRSA